MTAKFNVALVAAAKNEAAYIADWVFHHLHFGFSPIFVYVNRSTDGTEPILRRLAKQLPNLIVRNLDNLDHLDPPVSPQRAAYKRGMDRLKQDQGPNDYTMFLDIDEFWTPADFTSTIQDVIAQADHPTSATFNWFQLTSDSYPFLPPFAAQMEGVHHSLLKTAFRSRMWVRGFNVYGARPTLPRKIWNAAGQEVLATEWFQTQSTPTSFGPAFITHRFYRSPLEYLAILDRGRSDFPDLAFKDNRYGYHDVVHAKHPVVPFAPADAALKDYEAQRLEFHDWFKLDKLQKQARKDVSVRARDVLARYHALDAEAQKKWKAQFRWLDLRDLARQAERGAGA